MNYTKNTNTIMVIKFNKKNKITAIDVSIWRIIWEYICWTLAGKPEGHKSVRLDNEKNI